MLTRTLPWYLIQDTEVKYPQMIVVEGVLSSSVYTYLPGVLHVTTLYNISGQFFCVLLLQSVVKLMVIFGDFP